MLIILQGYPNFWKKINLQKVHCHFINVFIFSVPLRQLLVNQLRKPDLLLRELEGFSASFTLR